MYNNNIPQADQAQSQSQPQMLANFIAIKAFFEAEHGAFDTPNEGRHDVMKLVNIEQADIPATSVTNAALYCKDSTLTGQAELYVKKYNSAGGIPGNSYLLSGSKGDPMPLNGWVQFPSGILLKWGTTEVLNTTNIYALVFPIGADILAFSAIHSILMFPYITAGVNTVGTTTTIVTSTPLNFTYRLAKPGTVYAVGTPVQPQSWQYLAIGVGV